MSLCEREQLRALVGPIIHDAQLELFDLKLVFHRGIANIDLVIDHVDGGISIDECADINCRVNEAIEEDGLFGDDYTVSVASPGLDWPLRVARDFRRLIGQKINVQYNHQDVNEEQRGILQEVADDRIVIKTLEGKVEILFENIEKAILLI